MIDLDLMSQTKLSALEERLKENDPLSIDIALFLE